MKRKTSIVLAGMLVMASLSGCGDEVPLIDSVYTDQLSGLSIEEIGVSVIGVAAVQADTSAESEEDTDIEKPMLVIEDDMVTLKEK